MAANNLENEADETGSEVWSEDRVKCSKIHIVIFTPEVVNGQDNVITDKEQIYTVQIFAPVYAVTNIVT